MIFENVAAGKNNNITLADKEFAFKTFEDRPAHVRMKDDKIFLFVGEKGKKHIYDGGFVLILPGEAKDYSWKLEDGEMRDWPAAEKRIKALELKISD